MRSQKRLLIALTDKKIDDGALKVVGEGDSGGSLVHRVFLER
jgi:hypothetical protein